MSNTKTKTKITSISLPPDVIDIIKNGAKEENRSVSNYIAHKFRKWALDEK